MSAKSIGGGAETARPSAAPSAEAASFRRDLQRMLDNAGVTAQAGAPGKAKGTGGGETAADPKTRKNSSPAQDTDATGAAGSSAMPLPGAFAAGAQAWNFDAGRPLALAAGNSSDGTASDPGSFPQPMDVQDGALAPGGLPGVPAGLAVLAAGAPEADSAPGTLESVGTRGEASPVDTAVGSGGAGLPVSSAFPAFGAETGFAAPMRQPAGRDSFAAGPRRLEAARPVAGKGQGSPAVGSAPPPPAGNTVAGSGEPRIKGGDGAPVAGSSPASVEGAEVNFDAFSAFSASVLGPGLDPAVSPDPGSAGAPAPGWVSNGAAGSKLTGTPGAAGPGSGGSVPFAGHLAPAPTIPLVAAGGAATGDALSGQPLSAPWGQSMGSSGGGGRPAATTPGQALPAAAGEPSLAAMATTHLVQSLGRSEMQVHLNAAEFGRVSVHATYGREGIAAQISLENTDLGSALGSALSAHLPAMERKLGADGGARASVSVSTETGAGAGNGGGQGSDASPRRFSSPSSASPHLPGSSLSALATDAAGSLLSAPVPSGAGNGRRLDIRI